jgi:hypothetical protein
MLSSVAATVRLCSERSWPKRLNEGVGVASPKAQSPPQTFILCHSARVDARKATEFSALVNQSLRSNFSLGEIKSSAGQSPLPKTRSATSPRRQKLREASSDKPATSAMSAMISQVPGFEVLPGRFSLWKRESPGIKNPVDATSLFVKFPARLTDLE